MEILGDIYARLVIKHVKKSRTQKFRLTLLDGVTDQPIAEELHDSKDPTTIMAFLGTYLDPSKRTFVVLVQFWIRIVWILDRKSMWDHFMVVYYLQTR
ncbi:MAG: hypothetical protein IMF19_14340 [Proteobacteria bacterium]|jgi:hypothetical protein|nr:hypothetical protein [Pseudomonadota bacterium]